MLNMDGPKAGITERRSATTVIWKIIADNAFVFLRGRSVAKVTKGPKHLSEMGTGMYRVADSIRNGKRAGESSERLS